MREPGSANQFSQRCHRLIVEVGNASGFIWHDECALANRILRRDTGRAFIGVARQRLQTTESEHEAARRITPISTKREYAQQIERRDDLAGGAKLDALTQADRKERVVHETQTIA